MEDNDLLNQVFRFKHKLPSNCQDDAMCGTFAKWFAAFVTNLKAAEGYEFECSHVEPLTDDRVVPASLFTTHELQLLQQLAQRLTASGGIHKRGDVWYDPWLPAYGCVVQRNQLSETRVKIEVVFVDGWKRTLHFLPSGQCVHSAAPETPSVLHCANLDTQSEAKFSDTFSSKLSEAKACTGSERSAARNNFGHQKTPQFIAAVVRRTVSSIVPKASVDDSLPAGPRGGTTDVGLHTGGQARDTCWAIVKAVIEHNLGCEPGLFQKTIVAVKLKLLQMAMTNAERSFGRINLKDGCASVDDLFYMLQVIVQSIVQLLKAGYEVSMLEKQCATIRSEIDKFADKLNHENAEKYVLPEETELRKLNELSCGMDMISPKKMRESDTCASKDERRQRAWANLDRCCFLNGTSCTLNDLLQWSNSSDFPASYKCILILRTVEAHMFEKALLLNGDGPCGQGTGDNTFGLEQMQTLVSRYESVVTSWHQLPRTTSVLNVEQRSRNMLVKWIAFCLVHQRCVREVSLCTKYNIALDWKDLKVAVLSNQAAITALQHVAQYIRTWNNTTQMPPLFHLTQQEPTFEFGQRFGLSSTDMVDVYNREVEIWEERLRVRWSKIEKKKQKAANLRAEISRLHQNLSSKRALLADEEERLRRLYSLYCDRKYRYSTVKSDLETDISSINSTISINERMLSTALAAPRYLVRPLPPAKNDAIRVIFMLTMPRNIEILGSLCLTAQRSLTPDNARESLPNLSPTTWQQFYYQNASTQVICATSTVFTASPAPFYLPGSCGPTTVDSLYSLSQYRSECVWNPNLFGTALTWVDALGKKSNPFDATQSSIINSFNEVMPRSFTHVQWMNAWPGEGVTRGNMIYANLDKQLQDFEKMSFIALGSLRAFPNQQFRKLQWALLNDVLPWSNHCVEIIVRQSLYQVGVLTDDLNPQLLWKSDMFNGDKGLKTFCATLESIASKLKQTPRNFESVPLLSELAGFTLQYSYNATIIVKMFAGMSRRWATDARCEYEKESSPDRIAEIRSRECILYGFALLSYSLGLWNNESAQEVCELIVLFRTSFLCASINLRSTEQMVRTEGKISEVMSRRVSELVTYVRNNGADTILTGLVRLVGATCPGQLGWYQFSELSLESGQFGSCFEAYDEAMDVHYSINLFTGIVLTPT